MGQKVNPNSFRLQIRRDWQSIWYTSDNLYSKFIELDFLIRKTLYTHYKSTPISKIIIERSDSSCNNPDSSPVNVSIYSANCGSIIGKSGKGVEIIKNKLKEEIPYVDYSINVLEVKRGDIDAAIVAKNIAMQLEKRGNYKRAVKRALESAMKFDNCLGIKVTVSGRLAGAEIAKSEIFKVGSIPLHKLTADIQYGVAEAKTTYGIIGIKTWIYLSD